jgi:hypothetical protein
MKADESLNTHNPEVELMTDFILALNEDRSALDITLAMRAIGRFKERLAVLSWLPDLRGWDEAETITDWPAGFCQGEADYRARVIAALCPSGSASADPAVESGAGVSNS